MRTRDAVDYFRGVSVLADRLGISRKSVWKWGEYPPPGRQYELEVMTGGALQAEARHRPPTEAIESPEGDTTEAQG